MLSFLYVYSDHSILECYNLFSGVELSVRSFFVIPDPFDQMLFFSYVVDAFSDHHSGCMQYLFSMWHDFFLSVPLPQLLSVLYKNR